MFDDESDIRAMEQNLLCHFACLARRTEAMEVIDTPEYLLLQLSVCPATTLISSTTAVRPDRHAKTELRARD